MNPANKTMLFTDAAALGAPGLILLAAAIVALIVWLAVGNRDPDPVDALICVAVGVIGLVVIAFAGSWHEVSIDPVAARVTERYGFLGHGLDWLGQRSGFKDFTTVLVERTTSTENAAHSSPGSQGAKTSVKSTRVHGYSLSLRGADREVTLPTAEGDTPLILEASARQLARLGGWTAKRRGYALPRPRGAEPQHGPVAIQIIAADAESLIDEE